MQKMQENPYPRRAFPSLRSIIAFEAAARTQSFARAAEELSLSQSAVSRQIAQLEQSIGFPLFHRAGRRVALTPAGQFYAGKVREAMARLLAAAGEAIAFEEGGGVLRLGVLPTFGARWLIPRISSFTSANPNVTLQFNTRFPGVFDLASSEVDAALLFGEPVWPGAKLHLLIKDTVIAVASPSLIKSLGVKEPQDVVSAALISHSSRPMAWREWLDQHGLSRKLARPTIEFQQFMMAIQAAVSGIGIAIVPSFMVRQEIDKGVLEPLFEPMVSDTRGDYLVYLPSREDYPPLVAFREWLLAEIKSDM
jgi:LysR family glycine cleavage system transcriptional activator